MKIPFTIADGPLTGCKSANGFLVDSALVGVEPTAGDQRFILSWQTKGQFARGLYKLVRSEDGSAVSAVHVPGVDDLVLTSEEVLAARRAEAAVAAVRKLAAEHPEVAGMLKEGA